MKIKHISYGGWKNCLLISNNVLEMIVTLDVGPRVIFFGFIGDRNNFKIIDDQLGLIGGDVWRSYGGHRLWLAPEDAILTYIPDNNPVEVVQTKDEVIFTSQQEKLSGLQKQIKLRIDSNRVFVNHTIYNLNQFNAKISVWGLSVMASGGKAIVPLPPRGEHPKNLLPTSSLVIWPYTYMNDERIRFDKYSLTIRQDENSTNPLKIGMNNPEGWFAYINGDNTFIKYSPYKTNVIYPDLGSNLEIYTDPTILELESLSPLKEVAPNNYLEQKEIWCLKRTNQLLTNEEDLFNEINWEVETIKKLL
jgi:hypothetical protein